MEQRFSVFIRDDARRPEVAEAEIACYPTYLDARSLQRELIRSGQQCVIRSTGLDGGGE
jgi:hypothetical protein